MGEIQQEIEGFLRSLSENDEPTVEKIKSSGSYSLYYAKGEAVEDAYYGGRIPAMRGYFIANEGEDKIIKAELGYLSDNNISKKKALLIFKKFLEE